MSQCSELMESEISLQEDIQRQLVEIKVHSTSPTVASIPGSLDSRIKDILVIYVHCMILSHVYTDIESMSIN